ncbi:MAG TPA: 3-oxoacyl-[acyl-carrier-protein] reductase [Candidatus Limnocylindrales bacterium]|nr:3-oxoacyl-[acyl-carrier-protein] reductase [Candidatus Limnocylindrales bacterium]
MSSQQTALVTGAGRGIGREIAMALADASVRVVINYNNSAASANALVDEICNQGGEAVAIQANVADFSQASNLVKQTLAQWGSLDVLVNNAGITRDTLLVRMTEEDWDQVLDVNLKSYFNCCRAAARPMIKARNGRIINIASVAGIMGNAGQANYAAAKAGVIGLTKSLARELSSRGITVNAVAPGFIETDMTSVLHTEVRERLLKEIPMGRFGKTRDVAQLVKFLASPHSDYITGQVIAVDGGMSM